MVQPPACDRSLECGVIKNRCAAEYCGLQAAHHRRRIDAEFFVKPMAKPLINVQGITGLPRSMFGQHQLCVRPFTKRMLGNQRL